MAKDIKGNISRQVLLCEAQIRWGGVMFREKLIIAQSASVCFQK